MGAVKNHFHDEICARADDQRADEFDCYEARLHSLLSELDWFTEAHKSHSALLYPAALEAANELKEEIRDLMK